MLTFNGKKIKTFGGPTLHLEFFQISKELYAIENVIRIDIISNFQQPVEFWERLKPYRSKMSPGLLQL